MVLTMKQNHDMENIEVLPELFQNGIGRETCQNSQYQYWKFGVDVDKPSPLDEKNEKHISCMVNFKEANM